MRAMKTHILTCHITTQHVDVVILTNCVVKLTNPNLLFTTNQYFTYKQFMRETHITYTKCIPNLSLSTHTHNKHIYNVGFDTYM